MNKMEYRLVKICADKNSMFGTSDWTAIHIIWLESNIGGLILCSQPLSPTGREGLATQSYWGSSSLLSPSPSYKYIKSNHFQLTGIIIIIIYVWLTSESLKRVTSIASFDVKLIAVLESILQIEYFIYKLMSWHSLTVLMSVTITLQRASIRA